MIFFGGDAGHAFRHADAEIDDGVHRQFHAERRAMILRSLIGIGAIEASGT